MENNEKEEKIRQLLSKVFDGIREKENSLGGYHHDSDKSIYYLKQILEIDPLCEAGWYQLYCEYLYGKYNVTRLRNSSANFSTITPTTLMFNVLWPPSQNITGNSYSAKNPTD